MNTITPRRLVLQWLALVLAFGGQFIGLALAYMLFRSDTFSETLGRFSRSNVGDNGWLAVSFAIGLAIQAVLSIITYLLWPRKQRSV